MHTLEIPDNNKTITIPAHWDECTHQQAHYILQRGFETMSGKIDIATFRLLVFCHLTGFTISARYHYLRRMDKVRHAEITARIQQLADELCDWPFTEDEETGHLIFNYDTVQNHLPTIKIGTTTLQGPADLLSDITFGQFRSALRAMDAHATHAKDPDTATEALTSLDDFVSILYLPVTAGANGRKSAHQRMSPVPTIRARWPGSVPRVPKLLWQKQTILLWFSHCVKYIQSEDIVIDGNTINLSVLFPKNKTNTPAGKAAGVGWVGLLYDIAKEGVFGDAGKTDKAGLFDILIYMYKQYHHNKEIERKSKKK